MKRILCYFIKYSILKYLRIQNNSIFIPLKQFSSFITALNSHNVLHDCSRRCKTFNEELREERCTEHCSPETSRCLPRDEFHGFGRLPATITRESLFMRNPLPSVFRWIHEASGISPTVRTRSQGLRIFMITN